MKKFFIVVCLILSICLIFVFRYGKASASMNGKLIRFHVIANSDSDSDQSTKLKVRDAVLEDIGPELSKSRSVAESYSIIEKDKDRIEKIANSVLKKEGKNYTARAMLGKFTFPVKNYGSITLPAGEYTALRVVLGNGDGKNWWCVMFPPLCFIDITRGLSSEETDDQLKRVLSDEEISSITAFKQQPTKQEVVINPSKSGTSQKTLEASAKITNAKSSSSSNSKSSQTQFNKVEFRFKSAEIFKRMISKLEALLDR